MPNKNVIDGWRNVVENSPELKCNHCGVVFKGRHICEYEKLKEMNKELKSLSLWSIRRLHTVNKVFAYDEYEKITGEEPERV